MTKIEIMLVHAHSGLRWLVLGLLIYAIYNAFVDKRSYEKKDKMINLFAMISLHIQLLLGLILYYTSGNVSFEEGWMKNPITCLLYTSPSPRDRTRSRMPSSA